MSQSLYDRLLAKKSLVSNLIIIVSSARQVTSCLFINYLIFVKCLKYKHFLRATSVTVLSSAILLVGCGQKGNLYMPEQANANTDFIIYKPIIDTDRDKYSVKQLETDKDIDIRIEDGEDY